MFYENIPRQDSRSPPASKRLENGDSSPLANNTVEKKPKKDNIRDSITASVTSSPSVAPGKHGKVGFHFVAYLESS